MEANGIASAAPGKRWRGKRVHAVDGRKLNLNRSEQVQRAFPAPKGAHCPQALYSLLIDVCERRPIDFELDSVNTSEREHLGRMLDSLERGAVLLLERGYPSHELLRELLERGLDFVIRVPASSTFTAVDRFRSSGAKDARVTIEAQCAEHAPLGLRLVRREGRDGPAFYLTNLRRSEFDRAAIVELYRMRWQVEECFKLTASALLDQGLFRSRSENGVRQEIGALTLLIALSRAPAAAVVCRGGACGLALDGAAARHVARNAALRRLAQERLERAAVIAAVSAAGRLWPPKGANRCRSAQVMECATGGLRAHSALEHGAQFPRRSARVRAVERPSAGGHTPFHGASAEVSIRRIPHAAQSTRGAGGAGRARAHRRPAHERRLGVAHGFSRAAREGLCAHRRWDAGARLRAVARVALSFA